MYDMHMANSRALDLQAVRCFDAIMRERSVSRAAERLGMSQPAVSHALARLRVRFSDPLLVRGAHGMTPTPRALALHDAASAVLDGLDRLESTRTRFDPGTERSRFVVTITDYFERLLAPALAAQLRHEAPGVCIEWRAPNPALAHTWMERGEVDLRLGWLHTPWTGLRFSALFEDRLVCLVREDHPAVGRRLRLDDFFELPHIRPAIAIAPGSTAVDADRWSLEAYLGLTPGSRRGRRAAAASEWEVHRGRTLRIAMLAQSFLTIPHSVAASDAIATVPRLLVRAMDMPAGVRVVSPPMKLPPLHGAMYWHERTNADPRQRWFRGVVSRVASGLTVAVSERGGGADAGRLPGRAGVVRPRRAPAS